MGLLPDIVDGRISEEREPKMYTPPPFVYQKSGDKRMAELNAIGRRLLQKDFSDSPALDN